MEAGTPILKLTKESVEGIRTELSQDVTDAELVYQQALTAQKQTEVDAKGEKILKPEDIISEFLKPETRPQTMCCLAWDIPFGENEEEHIISKVKKILSAKKDMDFAWEVMREQQVLRVAALGTLDKMEEFAVRMREIEQRK